MSKKLISKYISNEVSLTFIKYGFWTYEWLTKRWKNSITLFKKPFRPNRTIYLIKYR